MSSGAIFLFWFSSYVFSQSIFNGILFQLVKILGDNGYVIELDKLDNFRNTINNNYTNSNSINMFIHIAKLIPVINIILACYTYMQYTLERDALLTQLDVFNCIRRMTAEELRDYEKNKSILFLLDAMSKDDLDKIDNSNSNNSNNSNNNNNNNNNNNSDNDNDKNNHITYEVIDNSTDNYISKDNYEIKVDDEILSNFINSIELDNPIYSINTEDKPKVMIKKKKD